MYYSSSREQSARHGDAMRNILFETALVADIENGTISAASVRDVHVHHWTIRHEEAKALSSLGYLSQQ